MSSRSSLHRTWCLRGGIWIGVVLAGAGCSLKSPFTPTIPPTPASWSLKPAETPSRGEVAPVSWWEHFNDPAMVSLVRRAVAGSPDIRTAVSRLREARASVKSTAGARRPSVDASASGRASGSVGEGTGDVTQLYSAGLDASWQIDLFGGASAAVDSATATAQARQFDLQDALVALAAEVALNYIDVRALQERLTISTHNLALQEETLSLTRFRLQAGLVTDIDLYQASTNVENTGAQIASLRGQMGRSKHALAVLLGLSPAALDSELAAAGPIPNASLEIAVGVPADAVRRRPDVRSAEQALVAQFHQVTVAQSDLRPSLRLVGSIGLESLSLAKLLLPGAAFWSAGPSVSMRLFNRDQLRQNLAIQTERQEQSALAYESRVLDALREVEDALTALTYEVVRRDRLIAAAAAAEQSAQLSLQLYSSGLRDFRDVLDAQRTLLNLEDSLASSRATVSSEVVRLYTALGGGLGTTDMAKDAGITEAKQKTNIGGRR